MVLKKPDNINWNGNLKKKKKQNNMIAVGTINKRYNFIWKENQQDEES